MIGLLFFLLLLFFLVGIPIAISVGLSSAVALFLTSDIPSIIVAQRQFTSIDSFPIMAIPFFILAGMLMETGGISRRLINLANSITGHITGGLAMVAVVTSMFMAAITGTSVAAVSAMGIILIPAMIKHGYHKNYAAAIQAVSGELGVIIPPSVPMILYAVSTETSVGDMFMAGILPGILIGITLLITVYITARLRGYAGVEKSTWKQRWLAFQEAFWALLMPLIILGGIYSGVFTPTEAAAVAVVYAFIVGKYIYKELTFDNIIPTLGKGFVIASTIMFIIANAGLFSWILSRAQFPQMVAQFFASFTTSEITFILIINLMLFIVGMFFETGASIIILAPLLTPVAVHFGFHPVHFGLIMIVNLAMGMCTPPLGVNLFVSCSIAGIRLDEIIRPTIPFLLATIISLLIISLVPPLSLWLPQFLK